MITDYYGKKRGTTYLEISWQPDGDRERVVHRQLRDQEAYDAWHLALYFKEILSYKHLIASEEIAFEKMPRKEKNLLLYLILACQPRFKVVLELGSSLFEMIDGLELAGKYFLQNSHSGIQQVDLRGLLYVGVEISELLSLGSVVMHPEYRVSIYNNLAEVKGHYDVFYDRAVASYAFVSAGELADCINRSEVALMNLFVSRGETFVSSTLGKSLTYFSLEEVVKLLNKPLYHLFGKKAPGALSGPEKRLSQPVVEGFFLCSQPDFASKFMAIAQRDARVWEYFNEKKIVLKDAMTLLWE